MSFESLALVTGERANESMNAKTRYSDEPIGKVEVIEDFFALAGSACFSRRVGEGNDFIEQIERRFLQSASNTTRVPEGDSPAA